MKDYLDLLRKITMEGEYKEDRTGTGTRSIFGHQIRFDLSKTFPLVTTKKTHLRSIIEELIWFLKGDTNITYLKKQKVRIWDEWANPNNDLGPVYSAMWRRWPVQSTAGILLSARHGPEKGSVLIPVGEKLNLLESKYEGKYSVNNENGDNPFTIIEELGYLNGKERSYLIQFTDSGITQVVAEHRLKNKSVRKGNPYDVTTFGVGCVGSPGRSFSRRFYDIWYNMLSRCYSEKNPKYEHYGGAGVYVSPRWLCFETFLMDLSSLPYYEEWVREPWNYNLDKDYYGSNCYDVSTCVFLHKTHNQALPHSIPYQVTTPEGQILFFESTRDLCSGLGVSEETLRAHELGHYSPGKLCGLCIERYQGDKLVRKRIVVDQIAELIKALHNNPKSRRHIVVSWNPALLPDESVDPITNATNGKQALPPCHTLFQFDTRMRTSGDLIADLEARGLLEKFSAELGEKALVTYTTNMAKFRITQKVEEFCKEHGIPARRLSCQLYQRSADCGLGVPFNIASYSILILMLAQVVGMLPGEFIWTGGDCHIYENHREQIALQLAREPLPLPTMKLNPAVTSIEEFKFEDFELCDYVSHPHIPMPVAV